MGANIELAALVAEGRREIEESAAREKAEPLHVIEVAILSALEVPGFLRPHARLAPVVRMLSGALSCRLTLLVPGFAAIERLAMRPVGSIWRANGEWIAQKQPVPTLAMALALSEGKR